MTTTTIHTPFDFAEPVKAGRRRFWKQILPVTEIDYEGRKVKFDPDFHKQLELSYADKVYDQIPLVFADGDNRHNEDPRNFGGEILKIENRGKDGTWGLIEADREAAKAISRNPRLGVSARIRQGVEKNGKTYGAAVRHVLMTMFPRVQGMSPWQAVDLAEGSDIEVVDLTAITYKKEGTVMGKTATTSKGKTGRTIDLSRLSDEEFEKMLDLAQALADPEEEVEDEDEVEDPEDLEVEEPAERRKVRRKKSKTKITVEKDREDDDPDDEEEEEDPDEVALSDRANGSEALRIAKQTQIDLAEQRWSTQRSSYLDAGVPAFLLDLAEPVLIQPEAVTIDLSDDETIDASDIIRKMLDGAKGIVDLTGEFGHQFDLSANEDQRDEADKFLDAWDEQYG